MSRSTFAVARHKKHKKVLKLVKGFRGRAKNCYRIAKPALLKSWKYAYVGRKVKKRDYRALWIQRINAYVRQYGMNYSTFIGAMKKNNIDLDRKNLALLAYENNDALRQLVEQCIPAISAKA
jgi:large subunit ribosomal protein L20